MPESLLYSDEAGCFTFDRRPNVSKYFIICTITLSSCEIGSALQDTRRKLIWKGVNLKDHFHATEDSPQIRDAVYSTILEHKFFIQATILEKSKAQPQVKESKARFYQYPWYYHFKFGIAPHIPHGSNLHVTAASIGNKKEKTAYCSAISDVMRQTVKNGEWRVDFRASSADPCLQVADYCAWAIQRKWERGSDHHYKLIQNRITYEYDLWKRGTTHYY